jgi:hypothetical protein
VEIHLIILNLSYLLINSHYLLPHQMQKLRMMFPHFKDANPDLGACLLIHSEGHVQERIIAMQMIGSVLGLPGFVNKTVLPLLARPADALSLLQILEPALSALLSLFSCSSSSPEALSSLESLVEAMDQLLCTDDSFSSTAMFAACVIVQVAIWMAPSSFDCISGSLQRAASWWSKNSATVRPPLHLQQLLDALALDNASLL